jgi:hypothetical protein
MTREQLRALFVREEERSLIDGVNRFVSRVIKRVETAAAKGETRVDDITLLTENELMVEMTLKRIADKFPDSAVGLTKDGESTVGRVYVDWSED